jgi:hypothetical protein
MILTAHQPVYLPWLGLFHKIALSDAFCYFDDVQYLKKDWNNRNKIKTQSGAIWLTVPVLTKGYQEKSIREIEIDNSVNWQRKHWKSIYLAYKKAPYFDKYGNFFEELYKKDWYYLTDLNEYMLKYFLKELGINVKYYKASELSFEGYKSGLVLDMCKKLGANLYIFGALGKDYAKEDEFNQESIRIYFQDYKHPTYSQLYSEFSPYMSIIDLLFNCGSRSLEILMEGNITKNILENTLKQ